MKTILYKKNYFEIDPEQSVLDCLTSMGVPVPSSCRNGVCQTCLMRAVCGTPPEAAQ